MSQATIHSSSVHNASQPIVACCTAAGKAALALLRVSGQGAIDLVDAIVQLPKKALLADVATHSIVYGNVIAQDGTHLDQVLFLVMRGPRTFTGEDVVEITCHNNRFVIDAIIARLCEVGVRHARAGEFTQRAVENGKIDMLQAEALHDLITAPSRILAKKSLAQLEGSLSHVVADIEVSLISLASLVEASFEFSEEEHIDLDFQQMVTARLQGVLTQITEMTAQQSSIAHLKEGIRVALVGSVNAGKSTLLNALLGRNRAIVSDQAGTTRDSIEASMSDGLYSWTFIDTAGLRETDDVIEKEGITRSHQAAHSADIVLLILDGSHVYDQVTQDQYSNLLNSYAQKIMVVQTKAECGEGDGSFVTENQPLFVVSAQTGKGMSAFKEALQGRIKALYESAETPFVLNQRHLALLNDLYAKLLAIAADMAGEVPYELIAAQLHEALVLLTELTGRTVTEKVMDTVFSSFCIGK